MLTVREHLQELRRRLLYPAGIMIMGSLVAYVFRQPIIRFLRQPLNQPLYYTSPTGSFEFVMQVCLLVGLLLALPVLCYNLIRFTEPAFRQALNRKHIAVILTSSFVLCLTGAAFAYYISLPAALHFFGLVGTADLQALISVDQYMRFLTTNLALFATLFQLPLVFLAINHFTPLSPRQFSSWRKYTIIGAFAVALILPTAPDPVSQLIIALPIIGLFELSNVAVILTNRRRQRPVPNQSPRSTTALHQAASQKLHPSPLPEQEPRLRTPLTSRVIDLRDRK